MLVPRFIKDPEIRSSASFLSIFSIKQHRVILQPYFATSQQHTLLSTTFKFSSLLFHKEPKSPSNHLKHQPSSAGNSYESKHLITTTTSPQHNQQLNFQTIPHDARPTRLLHSLPPRTFSATEHLQLLPLHPRPHKTSDASLWCPVILRFQHLISIVGWRYIHDQRRRSPDLDSRLLASVLEARCVPQHLAP